MTNAENMATIHLKHGREKSVERNHPWIFSGAIHRISGEPRNGDIVRIIAGSGKHIGTAHFQEGGSITARILTRNDEDIDEAFILQRLQSSFECRKAAGLTGHQATNAYRLVFGEGDRLPGLIIDKYADTAVIQCHTAGMLKLSELIAHCLIQVNGADIRNVYLKGLEKSGDSKGHYLLGARSEENISENGLRFLVDWEAGQKTGFFLDQRDNRQLLKRYSDGKKVLNTFSYTGGFSVYAAAGGASRVVSVDVSGPAIQLAEENMKLNGFSAVHTAETRDVFEHLRSVSSGEFDIIVLDPPAFAKSRRVTHNAIQGYRRLNEEAIKKLQPGGMLFTFSCSQVIDADTFMHAVLAASIDIGKNVRILHRISQPADHPVNIFHPEGEYLKGLVLYID